MRTLRALRPLRAVSRWEGMRVSRETRSHEADLALREGQGGVELNTPNGKMASKLYEIFLKIVTLMR